MTLPMTLKVAVLGMGKAGIRHLSAAEEVDLVEVVGVADRAPEVRARLAESTGVPVVEDLDALVALGPDAVIVGLPHALLADAALRAFDAGLHVLLEKPMATKLEDARRVVAAAEAAGVRLMVNYNHRFRDEYQTAKRLLQEGRIGRPTLFAESMYATAGPLPPWVWDADISGGGMLTYNGVHVLDHLMWLSQKPVEMVSASLGRFSFHESLEDTTVATLRFEDGSLANLVQHKSNVPGARSVWETRVLGTEGALTIVSGQGVTLTRGASEEHFPSGPERRFVVALEAFASAIQDERDPKPDGQEGVRVLECLDALYRSAETTAWVRVGNTLST